MGEPIPGGGLAGGQPGGEQLPWWRVLLEPTVLFLAAAGIVHVIRRNPFDITLFFGTIVLIVLDRVRRAPSAVASTRIRLSGRRRSLAAAVIVLYAAIAGGWEIDTWPMKIAVIAPGLLFAALIATRPPVEDVDAPRMGKGWIPWAVLGVAIALWELTSFILQPNPIDSSYQHPTISALAAPALAARPGRTIFLLLWVAAGFWLIRTITAARAASTSVPEPEYRAESRAASAGRAEPEFRSGPGPRAESATPAERVPKPRHSGGSG